MKAKNITGLKNYFNFEAPVFTTDRTGKNDEPYNHFMDLNKLLAPNPKDIYLVQVTGESMMNEGIISGDILVVNRRETPEDGKVVIAALNGDLAVKTYRLIDGIVHLFSANESFKPIEIAPFYHFEIQGVVKHVIHDV
jgi:DNA polymerase V